jgi:hypothetical protein
LKDTLKELMIHYINNTKRKQFEAVLEQSDGLINQFSGDEIVSKSGVTESEYNW